MFSQHHWVFSDCDITESDFVVVVVVVVVHHDVGFLVFSIIRFIFCMDACGIAGCWNDEKQEN